MSLLWAEPPTGSLFADEQGLAEVDPGYLGPPVYAARRPQRTVLYRLVQGHLETWLATRREACLDDDPIPADVEQAFRSYLHCGIWGAAATMPSMPCLHAPVVGTIVPSASMRARCFVSVGCCFQTASRVSLTAAISGQICTRSTSRVADVLRIHPPAVKRRGFSRPHPQVRRATGTAKQQAVTP